MNESKNNNLFEYKCPECENGLVRTTLIDNFKTKIKGFPFIVPQATMGICDNCGARQYSPHEIERWNQLYLLSLEKGHAFLSPLELAETRKQLGLSMEDFA